MGGGFRLDEIDLSKNINRVKWVPAQHCCMDLQNVLDAVAEQERNETFSATDQLTLGELVLLVGQADDSKPVVFGCEEAQSSSSSGSDSEPCDGEMMPTHLGSWRGSYQELAIRYDERVEGDEKTAGEMHMLLEGAIGHEYRGYKGGDYEMSSRTPVWVANRGTSTGFMETDGLAYQGVIGVEERDDVVSIQTGEVEF